MLGDEALVRRESCIVDQLRVADALVVHLLLNSGPTARLPADRNNFVTLSSQADLMNFIDLVAGRGGLCGALRACFMQSSCMSSSPFGVYRVPRLSSRLLAYHLTRGHAHG